MGSSLICGSGKWLGVWRMALMGCLPHRPNRQL